MENKDLQSTIHEISFYSKEREKIFRALDLADQAEIIPRLSKHIRYDVLVRLPKEELIGLLEYLDPDEATDLIQLFPVRHRAHIVDSLNEELRTDIIKLLQFDPETAGGLMNVDYIQVEENNTVAQALKKFKVHEKRTGRLPAIIVTREGKVVGYLPGHELGFAKSHEKVKKYIRTIATIPYSASPKEVVGMFRSHPHNKLVVLGSDNNPLGIIYSDDVLQLLHTHESKSLYDFAGVSEEERVQDSAGRKISFRYKWLIINLATAFLAAFTVSLFDATIAKYVLLAVYMPIVAGMGGNAATQTLAVLVRGIAMRQITLKTAWRTLRNEIISGFVNGLINGILVAAVVIVFNHNLALAIVLGAAMIINLMIAAIFGTLVPLIMKRLGKDPASSATIFITTATDVLGFLVFLGLATLVLH